MTKTYRLISRGLPIGITFLTFVSYGLPEGLLGIAWPYVRGTFGLPLDRLGILLTAFTIGYLLSSFNTGRGIAHLGVGWLLIVSNIFMGMGFLGYALAPSWAVMVVCGLLVGIGAGSTDAGLNTYVAVNHSTRVMSWSHASFGIGATVGPIIMTTILSLGYSWRYGYAFVAILKGVLALSFLLTLRRWDSTRSKPTTVPNSRKGSKDTINLLGSPVVWFSMAVFLLYLGIEITIGQWTFSLLTEARGVLPGVAGMWVSVYWGSLTAGRLLIGFVSDRIAGIRLVRVCLLGVLIGSALLSLNRYIELGFFGLALAGFAMAPIFPTLVSMTPSRVGPRHAANVIGFQFSAAAVGGALIPGLTGLLAATTSLEVIGPVLIVSTMLLFGLHELIIFKTRRRLVAEILS